VRVVFEVWPTDRVEPSRGSRYVWYIFDGDADDEAEAEIAQKGYTMHTLRHKDDGRPYTFRCIKWGWSSSVSRAEKECRKWIQKNASRVMEVHNAQPLLIVDEGYTLNSDEEKVMRLAQSMHEGKDILDIEL
jgi:hypothetical protein